MELLKRTFSAIWGIIETTTFALGFVMVTYLFLFQTGEVHGASSYPTWQNNDRFITDKVSYRFNKPQRGDFIVLKSPKDRDIDFLKRIIGLPGEIISINGGRVFIDGYVLQEPYLQSNTTTGEKSYLKENQKLTIPSRYYFVMGDNRENSSDSRDFGPIPESNIVGKVIFRFWPPDKIGTIY